MIKTFNSIALLITQLLSLFNATAQSQLCCFSFPPVFFFFRQFSRIVMLSVWSKYFTVLRYLNETQNLLSYLNTHCDQSNKSYWNKKILLEQKTLKLFKKFREPNTKETNF